MKLVYCEPCQPCDNTEVARTMLAISGQTMFCEFVRVPVDCRQVILSNKFRTRASSASFTTYSLTRATDSQVFLIHLSFTSILFDEFLDACHVVQL